MSPFFFFSLPGLGDDPNLSPSLCPSAPLSHLTSWDNLSSLPTQGAPLRHVTHIRPRPPRRHRPGHTTPDMVKSWKCAVRFGRRIILETKTLGLILLMWQLGIWKCDEITYHTLQYHGLDLGSWSFTNLGTQLFMYLHTYAETWSKNK